MHSRAFTDTVSLKRKGRVPNAASPWTGAILSRGATCRWRPHSRRIRIANGATHCNMSCSTSGRTSVPI